MNDLDYISDLQDRIAKIKAINEQYDLLNNSYIAFSGGKDSCVLSHLIDLALPNNNIPRVYANTGIEFVDMVKFVKSIASEDKRFIILNQNKNIIKTLNKYGYPFKSKEFSQLYKTFKNMQKKNLPVCKNYQMRIDGDENSFRPVPQVLKYLFTDGVTFKISHYCCVKLKKDLMHQWQKENNKIMTITGMRKSEGGNRNTLTCLTTKNTKFHPLIVINDEWENEFIKRNNIKLCKLYYEPFNFKRTGCKGCPFALQIQEELNTLYKLLPNEYYQCLHLWKPVYDEYIRIGYRLKYYPHLKEVNK